MTHPSPQWFVQLGDVGLLVADVPWTPFLTALRETSGESFEVGPAVTDWLGWLRNLPATDTWRKIHVIGGNFQGRSYILSDHLVLASTADRITALAAHSGGTVVGYSWQDNSGFETLVAARGTRLLRYVHDAGEFGRHEEGEPLLQESDGADAALRQLGFDVDGWLEHGEKWHVLWTMMDAEQHPDAHKRLYFGPLRQRVDYIEQAALEDVVGDVE
jgi:hypothetical protein